MLRQKLCTAELSTKIPFILSHSIFGALASANQFCSPQSLSRLFNLSPDQQKGFPFFLLSCFYSPTYILAPANPVLLQQCLWEPGDIPTGMRFTPSLLPFFPPWLQPSVYIRGPNTSLNKVYQQTSMQHLPWIKACSNRHKPHHKREKPNREFEQVQVEPYSY